MKNADCIADEELMIARLWGAPDATLAELDDTVTEIIAYREAGEMGYVAWFKVMARERLLARVNSKFVAKIDYVG
jgi:hypothetical protein